ncbi:uncharacterized protein LOC129920955 isoform X2 [Episyrphus balteatus]|uniref:uncharacterized protein LOC129920955 isoform X2 n=1 Tax=Episyrphus balteatus TaxID=286459 RepID=UPI002485F472|nr:uncharacterized protein LOC129920955 isoform X2 [Episyrphus balteatus]
MQIALQNDNLEDILENMSKIIETKSIEFEDRDSGWMLFCIKHIEVNINEYKPLRGSSYLKLPKSIDLKKACVNVQNNDKFCFKWAVISALSPIDDNSHRASKYRIENIQNGVISLMNGTIVYFTNLVFPLKLKDISIFETLNPAISVNVFGVEKNGTGENYRVVGPYYNSNHKRDLHINLLLIQEGEYNHYVWIQNMSRLIGAQINHDKGFEKHETECNKIVTALPNETNNILQFEHQSRSLEVPFAIYADFECMLVNIDSCQPDPSKSSTTSIKKHVPIAVSYFIKCSFDPSLNKLFKYTGK